MKKVSGFFALLGILTMACSFEFAGYRFGPVTESAVIEQPSATETDLGVQPWNDEDGQAIVGDETTPRFSVWVGEYIVDRGGTVVDNGSWYQGTLGGLTISWAEWGLESLKLGSVEGLYSGKAIFIAMRDYAEWTENSNVQHYEWVGTFIPEYSTATMSGWDVSNSTILQFDGTGAQAFVVAMSEEWSQIRKDLNNVP